MATPDGSSYRPHRQQGDRAGRARTPTCSSCRPRPRPGVGVFLVEPGDAGVTVVAQTFSDGDGVARLDLDGAVLAADRLVGEADGAADHRLRQLLRARRLRGAARHHRGRALSWTSDSPRSRARPPSWRPGSSRTVPPTSASRPSSPAATGSTATCGSELGSAGLLGLALPEEYDGAGLGIIELCRVLVEVGRTVAPIPLAAHGPASRLIAELGSDAQRRQWLPGAAAGAVVLTAAVAEERAYSPARPTTTTTASADGASYVLTGSKAIVPAGPYADAFLVPAATPDGVGVFLVDALRRRRARWSRRPSPTATPWPASTWTSVVLGADRLVGAADGAADHRLRNLLVLAASAEQLGITEGALRLTSSYAKTREQFGRPIGTFQAVSQRLADGYIDVLGQRLDALAGRVAARARGCPPTPRSRSRSSGRPTPATGSRTRPCTCTAVSASTSTARRTATSPPRSASSSCTAASTEQALNVGRSWRPSPHDLPSRRVCRTRDPRVGASAGASSADAPTRPLVSPADAPTRPLSARQTRRLDG